MIAVRCPTNNIIRERGQSTAGLSADVSVTLAVDGKHDMRVGCQRFHQRGYVCDSVISL